MLRKFTVANLPGARPQLMVERIGSSVQLTWKESGYILESCEDLLTARWTAISQMPQQNQVGSYTVNIPMETRRFFRLRRF